MTNVGEKDGRFEIWRNHSELKQLLNNPLLIFRNLYACPGWIEWLSADKKIDIKGPVISYHGGRGGGLRRILEGDSGGAEGGSVVTNRRV